MLSGWPTFSGILVADWAIVAPDGNPLILRDVSLNEIYALDFEAP